MRFGRILKNLDEPRPAQAAVAREGGGRDRAPSNNGREAGVEDIGREPTEAGECSETEVVMGPAMGMAEEEDESSEGGGDPGGKPPPIKNKKINGLWRVGNYHLGVLKTKEIKF